MSQCKKHAQQIMPLARNALKSIKAVADPGFDLRGAWTLSTGRGDKRSLKVLTVEVKFMFQRVWPYFY